MRIRLRLRRVVRTRPSAVRKELALAKTAIDESVASRGRGSIAFAVLRDLGEAADGRSAVGTGELRDVGLSGEIGLLESPHG